MRPILEKSIVAGTLATGVVAVYAAIVGDNSSPEPSSYERTESGYGSPLSTSAPATFRVKEDLAPVFNHTGGIVETVKWDEKIVRKHINHGNVGSPEWNAAMDAVEKNGWINDDALYVTAVNAVVKRQCSLERCANNYPAGRRAVECHGRILELDGYTERLRDMRIKAGKPAFDTPYFPYCRTPFTVVDLARKSEK